MNAGRCFVLTVSVLVLFTVARSFGLLGPNVVAVSLLVAALILIAWSSGATLADLGLGRADMGAGLLYGAGASGVVLLVLLVAAAVPATNGFLHDSRAQIDGGRLLYELGVSIVLLGSALRLWGSRASGGDEEGAPGPAPRAQGVPARRMHARSTRRVRRARNRWLR